MRSNDIDKTAVDPDRQPYEDLNGELSEIRPAVDVNMLKRRRRKKSVYIRSRHLLAWRGGCAGHTQRAAVQRAGGGQAGSHTARSEQSAPAQPSAHSHAHQPARGTQRPCRHGDDAHASSARSHRAPPHPARHAQPHPAPSGTHEPPCWQAQGGAGTGTTTVGSGAGSSQVAPRQGAAQAQRHVPPSRTHVPPLPHGAATHGSNSTGIEHVLPGNTL